VSKSLIVVASALGQAGNSATLAQQFAALAIAGGELCEWRILTETPPPPLTAIFVGAAFTRSELRDADMRLALAYSDGEIAALREAQTLVIATPMYNFGLPGLLKSWFDQIIRPHETFETTNDEDTPYRGLLTGKRCILLTVRGSSAFTTGGVASDMNFLDPHLRAMLGLIGYDDISLIDCAGVDDEPQARDRLLADAIEQINLASDRAGRSQS
jgi:FMN-dependent NADH-azoreductase